jgi:hypothetical protein
LTAARSARPARANSITTPSASGGASSVTLASAVPSVTSVTTFTHGDGTAK